MTALSKQKGPNWRIFVVAILVVTLVGAVVVTLGPLNAPVLAQTGTDEGQLAVVGLDGAVLYDAPGGKEIGTVPAGDVLTAVARSEDSAYIQLLLEGGSTGWVKVSSVVVLRPQALPVVVVKPTSTPTPTPLPPTPTPTPTQTPTPTPVPPTPTPTPRPPTATPTQMATPTAVPPRSGAIQPAATVAVAAPTLATPAAAAVAAVPADSGVTVLAVARANGATLYGAPNGESLASLLPATALTASARDASSQWIYVTSTDGDQGWAKISELVIFGVEELAVFESSVPEAAAVVSATDEAAPAEATEATVEVAATETIVEATPETSEAAAPPASETVAGIANVSGARLNIRSGPGQDYRIIGKASPGEELAIAARTADGEWLQVRRANLPNGFGWVAATLVQLEGAVSDLPVSDEISSGPPTAVPAATSAPTTVPAATPAPTAVPATAPKPATPAAPATVERTGSTGLTGTLVFQDGLGSLYAYDLGRGEVRWLTNGFDPEVSRDGSKVTFTRGGAIYAINTDGSGLREVYSGSEVITSPKWSPDGQWIVFSRLLGTYKCFNTEFLGCVTLVELGAMFPQIPPQFLDKLVSSEDRIELPNYGISRINADGKEYRDLNALDSAQAPDWNEDGIVYQSKAGVEVTADKPDAQTRSVLHDKWDWDPDWQPNGGRVVFQSREGPHWEIWSMNPDGSGLVALTRPETTLVDQLPSNVAPAWSPDGNYVVYVSNRDENEDAGPWRLWVMNADGSNKRPLPVKIPISYGFGSEQMVSWGQ